MAASKMASTLLWATLLAAACNAAHARTLAQAAPPSGTKLGVWKDEPEPLKSFDDAVWKRVAELAGLAPEVVQLATLDERFTSLESNATDWVVASISVTPERTKLVDFVLPFYYSAGALLYTPNGTAPPGVATWDDVRGKALATREGYYANDMLEKQYGATLVIVPGGAEAAAKIAAGQAIAFVDDSTSLVQDGGLKAVSALPPLATLPYGIAVKKGDTELASKISAALVQMATGGSGSDLVRFEKEFLIPMGAPPNPDLAALAADPTSKTVTLGKAITA